MRTTQEYYIVNFKYDTIPAKSKRFTFGKKYTDLTEIQQRGVYTFYDESGKEKTLLFYKLFKADILWLISNLEIVINSDDYSSIKTKVYNDFLKKLKTSRKDEIVIRDINFKLNIEKFDSLNMVRLINIEEVVDFLKSNNILREDNYDSELLFAFLTKEELEVVSRFGIIIGTSKMPTFGVNLLNEVKDEVEFEIKGTPNKTIIGVIDSGCNLGSPFNKYILSNEDHREDKTRPHDYTHGSAVTSLIIANSLMNEKDGCGIFNVKHFEVLEKDVFGNATVSFIHLSRKLRELILNNRDVKVWNLSLGAIKNPYSRIISELGKLLDQLCFENEIVFIVASGNDRRTYGLKSLNQPADSLNSLSVGSSTATGKLVTFSPYSSFGPILHFEKPEISHFGGPYNLDGTTLLKTFAPNENFGMEGTSFATPKISRMVGKIVEDGFNVLEAKATVISQAKRETPSNKSSAFGAISYEKPKIRLYLSMDFTGKEPFYFDLDLPNNYSYIKLTSSHFVEHAPMFGEEYSIHNIDSKIVTYDSNSKEPEKEELKTTAKEKYNDGSKYLSENILRYENGKYFNSHTSYFDRESILRSVDELKIKVLENEKLDEDYEAKPQTAIRIKKLDLFDTKILQKQNATIVIDIFGDELNTKEFLTNNSQLIGVEIDIEI
ncbi:S8 family serine peptidase [Mycoplasma todarodis]|uniref:Peptidase S8/S53 domain-containing protein n=1 Tax=Mycoplasma todarodis TaxID=1937191 RepID=A0A4R0XU83_9MOLU|nr:S8 family serine peptidase [Mycoplasma todarodis]TCG12098.1 hypothetical protein C4B25_00185 [Mycoplasma todarodis]